MDVSDKDNLAEKAARLKYRQPTVYGQMNSVVEDGISDNFRNRIEDRNTLKPNGNEERYILTGLYHAGVVEKWRENSERLNRYQLGNEEEISYFLDFVREFEKFRWTKRGIAASLKAISDVVLEPDENLTAGKLDEIDYGPSSYSVQNHYGAWNNALYFSNVNINDGRNLDEEEIRDQFRRKSYELGRIPQFDEIEEDENITSLSTIYRKIGSLRKLHEEYPYSIEVDKEDHLGVDKFEQLNEKMNGNLDTLDFEHHKILPLYRQESIKQFVKVKNKLKASKYNEQGLTTD